MRNENEERAIRMAAHYWMPVAEGEVQIRTARKSASLKGGSVKEMVPLIVGLLDGTRSERQVIEALQGRVDAPKVRAVLKALRDRGLIEDAEPLPEVIPAEDEREYETLFRYSQSQTGQRYDIVRALREARIVLAGAGACTASLVSALSHCGVGTIELLGDAPVTAGDLGAASFFRAEDLGRPRAQVIVERFEPSKKLVTLRHQLTLPSGRSAWEQSIAGATLVVAEVTGPAIFHPWLAELNDAAVATGVRWMALALLGRSAAQVGPTVVPETTPCLTCLRKHFDLQSAFLAAFPPFAGLEAAAQAPAEPIPPAHADLAANMAAIEAIRASTPGQDALTYGRVMTLRFDDLSTSFHVVPKQPRCPSCGSARNSPRLRIWS